MHVEIVEDRRGISDLLLPNAEIDCTLLLQGFVKICLDPEFIKKSNLSNLILHLRFL